LLSVIACTLHAEEFDNDNKFRFSKKL